LLLQRESGPVIIEDFPDDDPRDNQVDTTTGTVKLRAIFDNDQEVLFP
jgi:hypothetical protein